MRITDLEIAVNFKRLATLTLTIGTAFALSACTNGEESSESAQAADVQTDAPLYDQLPDAVKDNGYITIAADTHPPYRTIEENGDITGIDPDMQKALSEQLGVPFQMETTSGLDAMLTGMLSGRYEAFNGPVRSTPEREEDFDAIVWMTTRTSYMYLTENEDAFGNSEALCGARVAGVKGSVTESQLELYTEWCVDQDLDAPEFVPLEDTNSTILAVNSDRADYVGTTQAAAIDVQASDPGTYEYISQTDEQGAGVDQLAMFIPKDTDLTEPMFAAFEGIFENGEYERVMAEWEIEDVSVEEPVLNPMTSE